MKEDEDKEIQKIANRIKDERNKQKMSQVELSIHAGLSQNQLNYIEKGKRQPTLRTMLKICKALNIEPVILFEK